MRIRALLRSMLYPRRRASTVESSLLGELAPSFLRKIGSRPFVALNLACTCRGGIVHPSLAWWQETQLRPLGPRLVKKGLLVSTSPGRVRVWIAPVGVANGLRSSPRSSSLPSRAPLAPRIAVLQSACAGRGLGAPAPAKIS